jgi:hypothetical protein
MSRRYTVICHRCGKSTFVDLTKTVSDQRCRACRGFLQGVDVTVGEKPEYHRKLVVKLTGTRGNEPVWCDQASAVIPIRQRWPRYYRWIVAGGLVIFLVAIFSVGYVKFRDSAHGNWPSLLQAQPPPTDVRMTEEWRLKATAVARKALAAATVDELLPVLYHPEVGDDVIRRYYATEEPLPLGTDLVEAYIIPPGGAYEENVVAFQYLDAAKKPRAFVLVEKPGGMLVDWPSLVGLGEMSIKEYLRRSPAEVVVVRARARIGHYYNDYFSDSSKWLSIRLSDVTDENVIHGYYDRAMPAAAWMEQRFPNSEINPDVPDEPVIMVLKHPAGNLRSDQTRIVSLVATTWYHQEGLKPLIEQARKLDAVRSGAAPADTPPPAESTEPAPDPARGDSHGGAAPPAPPPAPSVPDGGRPPP